MKILIVGGGGREHAIGWKIKKDNPTVQLFFAPGNGGTAALGEHIEASSIEELKNFAIQETIGLTIVGPENELVEGIVDVFQAKGLKIFGPNQAAAALEGSKRLAKEFMQKYDVKTAAYQSFKYFIDAKEFIKSNKKYPIVVKASGLAAGKGVIICEDEIDAMNAIRDIMEDKKFGEAGEEVVIEEFLTGFEASILSIYNGKKIIPFVSAKDHKKIGEGETGLNTGGMGVLAPNPFFTDAHWQQFEKDILQPTEEGLQAEGFDFCGVIFFGLMINENGVYLLEYNMRFGDPETQATLPLLENNLLEVFEQSMKGENVDLQWKDEVSCCVVMVSGGYPLNYEKGFEIRGLEDVKSKVFIAGARKREDSLFTSGGRVLNVVSTAKTMNEARKKCYEDLKEIHFDYAYYREDI